NPPNYINLLDLGSLEMEGFNHFIALT
ncbi:hypothetical protein SAMN05421578_1491, partial [Paenibacillus macquariensis]